MATKVSKKLTDSAAIIPPASTVLPPAVMDVAGVRESETPLNLRQDVFFVSPKSLERLSRIISVAFFIISLVLLIYKFIVDSGKEFAVLHYDPLLGVDWRGGPGAWLWLAGTLLLINGVDLFLRRIFWRKGLRLYWLLAWLASAWFNVLMFLSLLLLTIEY